MEQGYTGYHERSKRQSLGIFTGITVLCLGSWLAAYLLSIGFPVYGGVSEVPLWNAFCKVLTSKVGAYLMGFLLMMGGAFLLQKSNYELMLIREKSLLPFFLNILLISTNLNFLPLNPASFGVFFLIVAISLLFPCYHSSDTRNAAFNISLILSLGSLLWIHILWFIPLFWYGLYSFRAFSFRTFLASLIGVVTIYWFVLGWCVWTRDFSVFSVFSSLFKIQLISTSYTDWINWIGILLVAFVSFIAVINILSHDLDDIQRTRRFLYLLILFGFWSFALAILFAQSADEFLQVACIPSSLLLAHFFTLSRGRIVNWLYALLLLSLAVLLSIRLWNFL